MNGISVLIKELKTMVEEGGRERRVLNPFAL
jgi:hypothetical protein